MSVSTHSRPKAAEVAQFVKLVGAEFQHTAARRRLMPAGEMVSMMAVSTHSRPKAAEDLIVEDIKEKPFQHTAARRRLSLSQKPCSIRFCSPDFAKLPRKA